MKFNRISRFALSMLLIVSILSLNIPCAFCNQEHPEMAVEAKVDQSIEVPEMSESPIRSAESDKGLYMSGMSREDQDSADEDKYDADFTVKLLLGMGIGLVKSVFNLVKGIFLFLVDVAKVFFTHLFMKNFTYEVSNFFKGLFGKLSHNFWETIKSIPGNLFNKIKLTISNAIESERAKMREALLSGDPMKIGEAYGEVSGDVIIEVVSIQISAEKAIASYKASKGLSVVDDAIGAAGAQEATVLATHNNYRKLYMTKYPNLPSGWQVHHTLPQKYSDIMKAAGINIHEVKYLKGIEPVIHYRITNDWVHWEKALGTAPTAEEIMDFAKTIDRSYHSYWFNP